MAALDDLGNLVNIIGGVQGSKTKQKGTTTSRTDISDEGINELIRGILAGEGGVASVGSAARRSGLYNSTVEDNALGNLYARAAGSAELARSPTVETMSGTIEQPGIGMGGLAGTMAGYQVAKKGMEMLEGAGGLSGIFGGGAGAGGGANAVTATAARGGGSAMSGAASGQAASSAASGASGFGMNMGTMMPLGGSFLSGFLGGEDAMKDPMSLGLNSLAGFAALGPMGAVMAPLASVMGGLFKKNSIICTALMNRGLLDDYLYAKGQSYLGTLSPYTRDGYYFWAKKVAARIDKGSVFWTRLCLPFAQQRTWLLASKGTIRAHLSAPLGTLTKFVGEPVCWVLGVARAAVLWATCQKVT